MSSVADCLHWIRRKAFSWSCLGLAAGLMCLSTMAPAARAQRDEATPEISGFDATSLEQPVALDSSWRVIAGDDPAYAQPGFDDFAWSEVDTRTSLRDRFPGSHPEVVWYRLHVTVSPAESGLALQLTDPSRAFELYVNGVRAMQSGRVAPFAGASTQATLLAPIADEQVATGSLVIALRVHLTPLEWSGDSPGLSGSSLVLGHEDALRQSVWLTALTGSAGDWTWSVIVFAVAFLALMLYTAQRDRPEYLWTCLLGLAEIAAQGGNMALSLRNVPLGWAGLQALLDPATNLLLILVYFGFVRRRIGGWVWAYLAVTTALFAADQIAYLMGRAPAGWLMQPFVYEWAGEAIALVIIPWVLISSLRRGNREAGILLVALLLSTLYDYGHFGAILLEKIPATAASATAFQTGLDNFHVGPIAVPLADVGGVLCWLSLAAIMVMRSNRATRRQAMLEGELAAAQQVQQVLVPEKVEAVPGFAVESVYQPAQQVGGDFFQILPAREGGLLLVLGDVAGKGLPAAMLVSVLVGAIRGVAEYTEDPAELLASLNERLVGRGGGSFSTALAVLIGRDGTVSIANAGHLPPYLDGAEVELPGALPLGVASGVGYDASEFFLPAGSRLTFYSDGVVEAQNSAGELFGFERAREISTEPAAEIVAAAQRFGQEDDITVVTIAREAAIASAA